MAKSISVGIVVENGEEARLVEQLLLSAGCTSVETSGENVQGFFFIPILVFGVGVGGIAVVAEIANKWRQASQCQQIIHVTKESVKIDKDCNVKNGKIVVIAADGLVVTINDAPAIVDLNRLIEAALRAGADVKKVADKAGLKASSPKRS